MIIMLAALLEKSHSLVTEVTDMARKRRATAATAGYSSHVLVHHDNGHSPCEMAASSV